MANVTPAIGGGPAATAAGPRHHLEVRGVSKRFGATQALADVSLALAPGEVHALVGENGAGKSTLGKVMAGVYSADSGSVVVDGEAVGRWDTGRAQRRGIVLIAQELSLVPHLTVAENVFLGVESKRFGVLRGGADERFAELEATCRFGLDPHARVGSLRLAEQQKVEIMRALARDARVLIMDEPTSSLTADETDKLHAVIAQLRDQGRTIVYVTHFLEAVLSTSDRVTIMRDGRKVRTTATADETKQSIVEGMLGRSLEVTFPPLPPAPKPTIKPLLELRGVSGDNGARDVSLHVRPGEIVGLAGLVGSGRTEIARLVFGADALTGGKILLDGKPLTTIDPRSSARRGVVLIPEDRRAEGLALVRSVRENIALPHVGRLGRAGILNKRQETKKVTELVNRLGVSPPRLDLPVGGFSGGNQQKVLFAKWLMQDPRVIILDEPTRGVDIGAKFKIYEVITQLAAEGAAILLISSEHEEVLNLSHRVYLIRDGAVLGEIDPTNSSVDDVLYRLFELDGSNPTPSGEGTL
jgi:simple sugar transport system ATP-binding protein/ribose transport system ATP-binding protein